MNSKIVDRIRKCLALAASNNSPEEAMNMANRNLTNNGLTAPAVHLNGSHSPRLEEMLDKAAQACQDALNAVQETYPHGRDYYVQDDDAYKTACAEHQARTKRLADVMGELMDLSRSVHLQCRARKH